MACLQHYIFMGLLQTTGPREDVLVMSPHKWIPASGSILSRLRRRTTRQDDNMLMTPHPSLSDQHVCLRRGQARDFLILSATLPHMPLFFHWKLPSEFKYISSLAVFYRRSSHFNCLSTLPRNQYPTLLGGHLIIPT